MDFNTEDWGRILGETYRANRGKLKPSTPEHGAQPYTMDEILGEAAKALVVSTIRDVILAAGHHASMNPIQKGDVLADSLRQKLGERFLGAPVQVLKVR